MVEAVPNVVQIISAVGAVVASLLVPYLVHRRVMADRATRWHRKRQCAVQDALIKKLQLELEVLEAYKTNHP